jgi:hypothetical protein
MGKKAFHASQKEQGVSDLIMQYMLPQFPELFSGFPV